MLCIAVGGRLAWPEMSVVMTFQAIRQIPCVTILRDVASPGSNEIEAMEAMESRAGMLPNKIGPSVSRYTTRAKKK